MSVVIWILVVILSFFWYAPVTVETTMESTEIVEGQPITPSTGPFNLDTGVAFRIGQTRPGSDIMYAASESTLYRSDASWLWTPIGDAPPAGNLVVADDPDVLMTGTSERCARGGGGHTVQVSSDGGASWTPSTDDRAIRPLAIWADESLAIGAWCGGILLSRDLGKTWESPPDDPTLGFEVTAFANIDGTRKEVLFALTGEGGTTNVYHVDLASADSWENLSPVFTYWALGGLAGSGDTFAVASITGVSISTDTGKTWTSDRRGLELYTLDIDPAVDGLPEGVDPAGMGLRSIVLDNEGTPIAVGGASDIFIRNDDGEWTHGIGFGEPATWLSASPDGRFVLAQAEAHAWMVKLES